MEYLITYLNDAGEWFLGVVPRMTLEVGILILVLLLVDHLLRGRVRATVRYGVWLLVLVKLALPVSVALPTAPGYWLQERASYELPPLGPVPSPVEKAVAGAIPNDPVVSPVLPEERKTTALPEGVIGPMNSWSLSGSGGIFLGWLVVAMLLAIYLLWRNRQVQALANRGQAAPAQVVRLLREVRAEIGLQSRPVLRILPTNHTPFVCGLWRPTVAISADLVATLDEVEIRGVLRHELCHLKRRDLAVNLVQVIVQVLFFFNPLLWWANQRIRQTREEAVDEMVLVYAGKEAEMYPRTLLTVARRLVQHPALNAALLGVVERRSGLRRRIEHMVERPQPESARLGWRGYALVLVLGLFLLPMGAAQGVVVKPQKPVPKPEQKPDCPAPKVVQDSPSTDLDKATVMIRKGLDWLARNQAERGKWESPGTNDVGVTGLALLAFLANGTTLHAGPYKSNLKRGVDWLCSQQKDDGLIGKKAGQSFMYSHLIGSLALCRAFGLSKYAPLKISVQKAVKYTQMSQNPYKAWRYYPRDGDNDTSMTTWAVRLLAEADGLGLGVDKKCFSWAKQWLEKMTDPVTGRVGYIRRGGLPARAQKRIEAFPGSKSEAMTAAGLYAMQLMSGNPKSDPFFPRQVNLIFGKRPTWDVGAGTIDIYYWYYGALALHRIGGPKWLLWRRHLINAAGKGLITKGNMAGSWPTTSVWGEDGGQVYTTALMVLTLAKCRQKGGGTGVAQSPPLGKFSPETLKELAAVTKILQDLPPEKAARLLDAWLPAGQSRVIRVLRAMPTETTLAILEKMTKANGVAFKPFGK